MEEAAAAVAESPVVDMPTVETPAVETAAVNVADGNSTDGASVSPAQQPLPPKVFDIVSKGNVRFGKTLFGPGEILAQIALQPGAEFGVRFITDMIEAGRLKVTEHSERS